MKRSMFGFFLGMFLLAGYAVAEPAQRQGQAGDTGVYTREAIGKGEVKETLAQLEANALKAERSNHWEDASNSYREASRAARISGQLQKAVSYGDKAVETGEKTRDPELQAKGILQLSQALGRLGQHAKEREWLQKGIEIAKLISPGPSKQNVEANLYRELGAVFLRSGEAQKAVEHFSYSVQVQESRLAAFKSRRRGNPQRIQTTEFHVARNLEPLGNAYERTGNAAEAIKAYEKGLDIIRKSGLKTHLESGF